MKKPKWPIVVFTLLVVFFVIIVAIVLGLGAKITQIFSYLL